MIRRYTLAEMGAIWSESARFEQMLRVELGVARAQSARGLIPAAAFETMEARARVDVDRIAEIERTTDHDIIAFVSQVAEAICVAGHDALHHRPAPAVIPETLKPALMPTPGRVIVPASAPRIWYSAWRKGPVAVMLANAALKGERE